MVYWLVSDRNLPPKMSKTVGYVLCQLSSKLCKCVLYLYSAINLSGTYQFYRSLRRRIHNHTSLDRNPNRLFAILGFFIKRLLKSTSQSRFSPSRRCRAILMRIFVFGSQKCRQNFNSLNSHHHIISAARATHINRMSVRQFTWTWAKLSEIVSGRCASG